MWTRPGRYESALLQKLLLVNPFIKILLRVLLVLVGLLIVALVSGFIYQRISEDRDSARFPAPGQLFDVDGRELHLNCTGSGSPTVILEAGGATPSIVWWELQRQLAAFTNVCSYDRAGLGWSDPSPNALSFEDGARDLKALLSAAEVPGPYIMVGHSKGGLHVRTYARLYPDDVSGVLLLDAAEEVHTFAQMELLESIAAETRGQAVLARIGLIRLILRVSPQAANVPDNIPDEVQPALLAEMAKPDLYRLGYSEFETYSLTPTELRVEGGFGRLGDVPLIVITHGVPFTGGQARTEPGWPQAQERLAGLSSNSELLVADNSGHAIFWDEPGLVVDAVQRLIAKGGSQE